MSEPRRYDVVVLGAGPAGENAAAYARQRGLTAVIVERELVGGECSYWACMPSKALLQPAATLAAARRLPSVAAAITGPLDLAAVLRDRDTASAGWQDDGQVAWLEDTGIDLVRGHGRLTATREVEVTTDDGEVVTLAARRGVVLATGSAAARPPIDGLDAADAWDNRDVTTLRAVPDRLLVIGGGVVGVEMAQAVRRLGASAVTVVEAGPRLLATEEPLVGEHLRADFEDDGIEVITDATVVRVARAGTGGPVTLALADGRERVGDELLVATGRTARTDDLGLETVGVTPGPGGYLEVDDHLRVEGRDGLYAVGDVNGRALLTHHGKYQARLVGDALAGVEVDPAWADERAVARVVFTDPQVAAVGWTEAQARAAGRDVVVVRSDLGDVAGGSLQGRGFAGPAQLLVDRARRTVLGVTFVGPGAGEQLHAATIAVVTEATVDQLAHAVPAFPTVSEVWLRLLEEVRARDLGLG